MVRSKKGNIRSRSGHFFSKMKKIVRAVIKHILIIINLFFIICYVCALLATVVPPDKTVFFSYFGLIFPVILLINVLFVILWLLREKRFWLLSGLLILVSFKACNNVFTISCPKKIDTEATIISLLTYNVSLFGGEKKTNEIVDFILEQNADIVCLQEFGGYNQNSKFSSYSILRKFSELYPYRHIWYKNQKGMASWGVVTFSKYPIIDKEKIDYESKFNVSVFSDIVIGNDTVRVINNHLESNKLTMSDLKKYSKLNDNFGRQEILDATVTTSERLGAAYPIRARQARTIAQTIANSPYKVVVCGDFNDVPQSYVYRTIKGNLQDVYTASALGYRYSYHQNHLYVGIDHVMIDNSFHAISCRIPHVNYSDHYPVIATFAIK